MRQLTHGSLFAGIGGFDLGFERAGMKTIWQVEIDETCRRFLGKHWPAVKRFSDVTDCCGWNHRANCPFPNHLRRVDVLSAGFPCQPHSVAGPRTSTSDSRWLWPDTERIIRGMGPAIVVLENVPGLLTTAFGDVIGGLASCGYDAEWQSISASSMGAPHQRDRVWIVAYPKREGLSGCEQDPRIFGAAPTPYTEPGNSPFGEWGDMDAAIRSLPHVHGLSVAMVRRRIKPYGNAIVPQIAEWIGRRIVEVAGQV